MKGKLCMCVVLAGDKKRLVTVVRVISVHDISSNRKRKRDNQVPKQTPKQMIVEKMEEENQG